MKFGRAPTATRRSVNVAWRIIRGGLRHTRRAAKEFVRPLASRLVGSIHGARTDEPLVSFTFDDGPDETETPRLLALLADHQARATFFILGERARRYPELVRAIRAAGHEVGSHSDVHRRLTGITLSDVAQRVRRGKRDLEAVLGEPIELFRPPYGFLTRPAYLVVRCLSLDVVAWSAEAKDWFDLPVDDLVGIALGQLQPGGILLLHERHEPWQVASPPPAPTFDRELLARKLLDEIAVRGWKSVTVGELLAGRRVDRRLWFRLPAPSP
jgi:peptidoglycan/xylan/chitin deacetylase (PgdA/CDA1 family)